MMMKKFKKSTRGLSPIFAVLILIAIAVIAGIIVYMFTSGTLSTMMGGGGAGTEKMAIQAVEGEATTNTITLYAQSTGGGAIVVDTAIIKAADGTIVDTDNGVTYGGGATAVTDTLTQVNVVVAAGMNSGDVYTVTLVSEVGGSFVSPSFKCAP